MIEDQSDNHKTGWIKIFRSVTNKSWFAKGDYFKLWCYLLMQATHKKVEYLWNGTPIILMPGQFVTGRNELAKAVCMHPSSVERALTFFEKIEHQIEQQKSNTSRLISIVNYDKYQTSEQPSEQRLNNERTTAEQRLNTKQECKELKNVRKGVCSRRYLSDDFHAFNRAEVASLTHTLFLNFQKQGLSEQDAQRSANEAIAKDQEAYGRFLEFIDKNAPSVNKLQYPFSIKEFIEIRERVKDSQKVKELLLKMDNWKPLLSKNKSAYKTFLNWQKIEDERRK